MYIPAMAVPTGLEPVTFGLGISPSAGNYLISITIFEHPYFQPQLRRLRAPRAGLHVR